MKKGFTLVELVIVIAIVIVLSVISVPIYRSYVDKAKWSEAYALLGTILTAQKAYYSEYGNFLCDGNRVNDFTNYEPALGVDARGNKYFTLFDSAYANAYGKYYFNAGVKKPEESQQPRNTGLYIQYNITKGSKIVDYPVDFDNSWFSD